MVSSRKIESPGILATRRSDFEYHWRGTSFRHKADQIDMNPGLVFAPPHDDTVQGTMAAMLTLIQSGADFVSIGDGVQSTGTYTISPTYPTIEDCFTAALSSLVLSSYGGFILVKSGLYNFTSTVTLPAGISVIGELGGTILNATTDNPIFDIQECPSFNINDAHITPSTVSVDGYRISKIYNLSFFDNYGLPTAILVGSAASCFIKLEQGSNTEIDKCTFMGRYSGAGSSSTMTRQAIWLNSTASSFNTILDVKNSVIFSTQKALTYEVDTTKRNKLSFCSNRVMCSGIISGTGADRNIILFNGCDAEFCNNDVKFGVGLIADGNQSIDTFLYCATKPPTTVPISTLVITGNRIVSTDKTAINASTIHNNLITFPAAIDIGENYRCVITGNTSTGSNESNSWYIIVGDGINTIGDINGQRALSYIYNYYRQENVIGNTTASALHEQITIFIKAGNYVIDGTSFSTTSTNFAYKLIGLPHDGNLPRISLHHTTPASHGGKIYLGSHIENISFEAYGNYLYKVIINDKFVAPDARPVIVTDIVVKNCIFYNTCLFISTTMSILDIDFEGVVLIEKCYFSAQDTFSNATSEDVVAIDCMLSNYRTIIRDCATKGDFFGTFLYFSSKSTYFNNDITVENCSVDYMGGLNSCIASINECRKVILKDNTFNLSNFIPGTGSYPYAIIINNDDITNPQTEAYVLIEGNAVDGYDDYSEFINAFEIQGFAHIDINNNIMSACPLGIYINFDIISTALPTFNINIISNDFIASANSYGFCSILSSSKINFGTVNILNNDLNMLGKGATSNRENDLVDYYPNDAGDALLGLISVDLQVATVHIRDNSIRLFHTNQSTYQEAAISCLEYKYAEISGNMIELMNSNISRYIYSIYANKFYPSAIPATNYNTIKIINNDINHMGDDVLVTDEHEQGITILNTKFVDIRNNTIKATNHCYLTKFITAYAGTDDIDACIGSIVDNIIYSQTDGGNAYLNETPNAITYYPPTLTATDNIIKMVANKNRGQFFIKDINCYDFIQYGYDGYEFIFGTGPIDAKPVIHATVLANYRKSLFIGADTNNLNYNSQMDILSTITSWGALPKGIYYTNAFTDGDGYALDALCNPIAPYPTGYKHQILIPIKIDDFVKLSKIDIPVYLYNSSGTSNSTMSLSASLIVCNSTASVIKYIPGNSAIVGVSQWEDSVHTLLPIQTMTVTLSHDCFNTLAGEDGYWLTPKFNTTPGTTLPVAQAYIVLAMTTSSYGVSTTGNNVLFAIPYARVHFIY